MDSNSNTEDLAILKTDKRGRVQRIQAERDAILDAFETSALSGIQFAKQHGLNYQTFMAWKRLRQQKQEASGALEAIDTNYTFLEVATNEAAATTGPITIHVAA